MCLSLKGMQCSIISTATCKFMRKKKNLTVIKLWTVFERGRVFCFVLFLISEEFLSLLLQVTLLL